MIEQSTDRFTDDELRELLRRILTTIGDGERPSADVEARIEAAIRERNDRR